MIKRLLLAAALALVPSCAGPETHTMDFAGYVLPANCRGDLSYVKTPITEATPAEMERLAAKYNVAPGRRLYGVTLYDGGLIIIDGSLRGYKRDDVIRHERCHVIDGAWHS